MRNKSFLFRNRNRNEKTFRMFLILRMIKWNAEQVMADVFRRIRPPAANSTEHSETIPANDK